MTSPSNAPPLADRDLADYGVARLRDQAFDAIGALWRRRQSEGWTQKRVADAIGRDPAWVSRNLRAPGNWTLRTIGELTQALDGESEITISPLEAPFEGSTNDHAYTGYVATGAVELSTPASAVPLTSFTPPATNKAD